MRRPGRRQGDRGSAFTMVELLVVLLILSILLALVVGISQYVMAEAARQDTISTQKILMTAIERYREAEGSYPDVPDGNDNTGDLMDILKGHEASRPLLSDLSHEAWPDGNAVKDGFGEKMKYDKDGGYGGVAVIISGGPDRSFSTKEDNIYSDRN